MITLNMNKKILYSLTAALVLGTTACGQQTMLPSETGISAPANNHVFKVSPVQTGATIRASLSFPGSFGTKAYAPAAVSSEVKSVSVYLTESDTNPLGSVIAGPFNMDINPLTETDYQFQFQNIVANSSLPDKFYWIAVTAWDAVGGVGGAGNNITLDGVPTVSVNKVQVDTNLDLSFVPASDNVLQINLQLRNAIPDDADSELTTIALPTPERAVSGKTDKFGNGVLVWKESANTLGLKKLADYMPSASTSISPATPNTIYDNVIPVAINSQGSGLAVYPNQGGNFTSLRAKKITNYDFNNDIVLASFSGKNFTYPSISLNENGDGMVVYSSDRYFSTYNILGRDISNFAGTGSTAGKILYSSDINKSNTALSLNSQGNGMLVWQENTQNGDIYAVRIENNDVLSYPGTGLISSSGNGNLSGSGAKFISELKRGSRVYIDATGEEYIINTTPNDNSAWVVGSSSSVFSNSTFSIKNINRRGLSGTGLTYNAGTKSVSGVGTLIQSENVKPGTRLTFKSTAPTSFNEILVVDTITSENSFTVRYNTLNDCSATCTGVLSTDDALSISVPSAHSSKFPAISLDHSGNGIAVWKDSRSANGIFYTSFMDYGIVTGDKVLVSGSNIFSDPASPSVAINSDGTGLVTWSQGGSLKGMKVSNFAPSGGIFSLSPMASSYSPFIDLNYQGHGILSWVQDGGATDKVFSRHIIDYQPN